jgi:hypothetical protein
MLQLLSTVVLILLGAAIALWAYHAGRTAANPIPTMYPRDMLRALTGTNRVAPEKDKDDEDEEERSRPQRMRA